MSCEGLLLFGRGRSPGLINEVYRMFVQSCLITNCYRELNVRSPAPTSAPHGVIRRRLAEIAVAASLVLVPILERPALSGPLPKFLGEIDSLALLRREVFLVLFQVAQTRVSRAFSGRRCTGRRGTLLLFGRFGFRGSRCSGLFVEFF